MTDPTDATIFLNDEYQIICRKKLDDERGNEWICGCELCRLEREPHETNLVGPPDKTVGVLRDDLATHDEPDVP